MIRGLLPQVLVVGVGAGSGGVGTIQLAQDSHGVQPFRTIVVQPAVEKDVVLYRCMARPSVGPHVDDGAKQLWIGHNWSVTKACFSGGHGPVGVQPSSYGFGSGRYGTVTTVQYRSSQPSQVPMDVTVIVWGQAGFFQGVGSSEGQRVAVRVQGTLGLGKPLHRKSSGAQGMAIT